MNVDSNHHGTGKDMATARTQHPAQATDAAGLQQPTEAVEHAVIQDPVTEQATGLHPVPSSLVLILKDSNGHWDSVPL